MRRRIKQLLKTLIKPALGLGLLALLIAQLEPEKIRTTIATIQWHWFIAAIGLLSVSQALSARRWQIISATLGLAISYRQALKVYIQGLAMNTVLPGGIVTGDAWRTLHLSKTGDKKKAVSSVFLDRYSGFLALGLLSLLAIASDVSGFSQSAGQSKIMLYGLCLIAILISPIIVQLVIRDTHSCLKAAFIHSVAIQVFAISSFYCCIRSLDTPGLTIGYLGVMAACAGIFLSSVVPASIGGFGARELGAVAFLSPLGISPEISFTASFLFGLAGTFIGAAGSLTWIKNRRTAQADPVAQAVQKKNG